MKNDFIKVTVLNGFHHVYPGHPLFERYIEEGRKEVIELYHLLPKEVLTGGYDAVQYTITVKVEPIAYTKERRLGVYKLPKKKK